MKNSSNLVRAALSILLLAFFQSAFSQNPEIEKIAKLNQDWLSFSVKKDTAAIAGMFADDFLLISPNGSKVTRAELLRNIIKQDLESVNIDSLDIRVVSIEVAIVTCYTTFVLKDQGKYITGKNCYQDVYIKKRGGWFAFSAHVTLLGMK